MRLIDADKLKKKAYPFPCAIGVEYAVTLRAIEEAQTVDAETVRPGWWIPVTERLPEKYEDVLITYRIPNEKAARIWFGYRVETGWCAYGVDRPNPTAWMPLPEPYEPDGAKMDGGVYDGTGS